jgi:hypothetical protein
LAERDRFREAEAAEQRKLLDADRALMEQARWKVHPVLCRNCLPRFSSSR